MPKKLLGANFMRSLAEKINNSLPKGLGFCLIIFSFNDTGIASYISNATRATMIEALKEKIKVLEQNKDFPTPEEN